MFTSKELALLKMLISEEINYISWDEFLDRESYLKELKKVSSMIKPYAINKLTDDMKRLIVSLIGMKLEMLEIELEDYADDMLISTLGNTLDLENGMNEGELVLADNGEDLSSEELGCLQVDITSEQAEIIAMFIIKREYEDLIKKFVS